MKAAIDGFETNIRRVRDLGALAAALATMTTSALDASDLLRAQIVLGVSALDAFVHELTRLGILEAVRGSRTPTPALQRFKIQLELHLQAAGGPIAVTSIDDAVRGNHSYVSFQQPDKIAEAIRLISTVDLWGAVGTRMKLAPLDVKQRLAVIVDRRNKIAHEADVDPSTPEARWPIAKPDVDSAISFLDGICHAIFGVV
jgi:hypothetical protein